MILMSLLLASVTFNPAMAPRFGESPAQGMVQAPAISPDAMCKPGAICASARLPVNRNGCHVNNVYTGSLGGTPLTIDITETGNNGSKVFLYWVNATSTTIKIYSKAQANYYCP